MRTLHVQSMRRGQRGITLIEFMVSIAIGMIVVAALATLIADQSSNRAEVDRAGRLIESGRYSARVLSDDMQMSGYWGELSTAPAAPVDWADPCGANPAEPTQAEQVAAMGLHVTGFDVPINHVDAGTPARQGYNGTTALPALPGGGGNIALSCLTNLKPGTDVIVVRRADADSSPYETAGVPDVAKLGLAANTNRMFMQAGLNPATNLFEWRANVGGNAGAAFDLKRKDKVTMAPVRKVVTRIYYVSTCSVCSGTPDTIPSLKMRELEKGGATVGTFTWSDPITIAEGVENLQVEYGVDAAATQDGAPDGADVAASTLAVGDWAAVVSVKLYILARSVERAPGFTDDKTYPLGLAGTMTPTADEQKYKRHVFVQSVRLVNPSFRRSL